MSKEFNVDATITFEVNMDIEAETEEEANKLAKLQINDYHRLGKMKGSSHYNVKYEIYANEYED